MTEAEIAALFIQAAEIDRRLPATGTRPRGYFTLGLMAVHTDEDRKGWAKVQGDQLDPRDANAPEDDRAAGWPTRDDVAAWERALALAALLGDPMERRALWAWAFSKAGGKSFAARCRADGIHAETGRRRKDRALARLARRMGQHNHDAGFSLLACGPEKGYVSATVAIVANDGGEPASSAQPQGFSWTSARNRIRRAVRKSAASS